MPYSKSRLLTTTFNCSRRMLQSVTRLEAWYCLTPHEHRITPIITRYTGFQDLKMHPDAKGTLESAACVDERESQLHENSSGFTKTELTLTPRRNCFCFHSRPIRGVTNPMTQVLCADFFRCPRNGDTTSHRRLFTTTLLSLYYYAIIPNFREFRNGGVFCREMFF